jgi:hypothetical protein
MSGGSRSSAPLSVAVALALVALTGAALLAQRPPIFETARSRVIFADSTLGPLRATQQIQVTVEGSASFDSTTGRYTYSYDLTNEPTSANVVARFGLTAISPAPVSVISPAHWESSYGFDGVAHALVWSMTDLGPPPANWDSADVYISPFHLQPGHTASGFKLETPVAPAMVPFFAQGFDTITGGGESGGPLPPTLFEDSVTGTIIGPAGTVRVEDQKPGGRELELRLPQPNPAAENVSITFYLGRSARVSLGVHDVSGRRVKALIEGPRAAGLHSATWNGRDAAGHPVPAGVYFYKLTVDGKPVGARRVTILR